jgi:hypothetical protein
MTDPFFLLYVELLLPVFTKPVSIVANCNPALEYVNARRTSKDRYPTATVYR